MLIRWAKCLYLLNNIMSNVTTELIKELRDATGISVMQCKNALEEAGGNMEKALAILKKLALILPLKKQDVMLKTEECV